MTATILAIQLALVIDDAVIFACRDNTLPMINGVQLESTAKHLVTVGTDRFVLGSAVADYQDGDGPTFTALLALPQAQMLARLAKSAKTAMNAVSITDAEATLTFTFTSGEVLTLPKYEGTHPFPDWRKLIGSNRSDAGEPPQAWAVNPQYLAKLARVHDSNRMVMKFSGPAKPAVVSVGSQFVGVIMPIRLSDNDLDSLSPEWMTPPKAAPKKRAPRARKSAAKKAAVA